VANIQTAPAPTAKEEQQASIPQVWKIKEHHIVEPIVDDAGKTWVKIEWSEKLHLFFDVPNGVKVDKLIEQMERVGYINVDKKGWYKRYPMAEEIIF
tara:strand:+ start:260 stop:550 length:291 start_codon:yes stop_codon:yes gene_type:complete